MTKKIYLDYAATTPMDPEVLKAMKPYFSEKFGNPSSLHSFGQEAMAANDESREKIAKAIGADFREIIFTGSATEANNLALRGVVKSFGEHRAVVFQKQNNFAPVPTLRSASRLIVGTAKFSSPSSRRLRFAQTKPVGTAGCSSRQPALDQNFLPLRIIVSRIEHESILETCRDLEQDGVEIIYLPVNRQGLVDLKKLKEFLNERTILVSIMYANNEIGTVQPIAEISQIINEFKTRSKTTNTSESTKNIFVDSHKFVVSHRYPLFHTDAVQAFQFLDCNVDKIGVDLMTLSAHKIYGPKGTGLLYRKLQTTNYKLQTIITGGGQEFGLRSGTENVPAIVGFTKAIELAVENNEKEIKRIAELANYFWKELKKIYSNVQLNNNFNQKQIAFQKQNNFFPVPTLRSASRLIVGTAKFSSPSARRLRLAAETKPAAPAGCSSEQFVFGFLPNILNIYFPNHDAQDLLMKLDLNGIAVSSGSACSTRSTQPSHVLKAIGLNEKRIKSSLRFSFGKFTTKGKINEAIRIIKKL